MAANDEEVDEIHHQLTENDGKLVPGNQASPFAGRCNFGNVHRADGRCQSHAKASQDTVSVERDQQTRGRDAFLKEQEFRIPGTQCAQQEEDAGNEKGAFPAKGNGQAAGYKGTDYTADEGAGRGETVHGVGVRKVLGVFKKRLQALLCAGYDSCVISEEQAAYHRHQHDADEIGDAPLLSVLAHYFAYRFR